MPHINCSMCWNSIHENFIEYSLIWKPLCEACKDENSDYFIFDNLTVEEKNTLLENISKYDISWALIGEGEWREVYDIDVLDDSLIIKKRKYKTVVSWLNYQNYVENFLYTRLKDKFSIIPKIYLPYEYWSQISNDRVFMEKCHILDESFFG